MAKELKTNMFRNEYVCTRRKKFNIEVTESESDKKYVYRHNAVLAALQNVLAHKSLEADQKSIEDFLNEFLAPYYNINKEREEVVYQTARQVLRYINYLKEEIKTKGMFKVGKYTTINMKIPCKGCVSFIFEYELNDRHFLETVIMHAGAARSADITAGGLKTCGTSNKYQYLQFFWQLLFNRDYLQKNGIAGTNYRSVATHVFLKRNDDSEGKNPNFDSEFTGKGAYNIITLGEDVVVGGKKTVDMKANEQTFLPLFKSFIEGKDFYNEDKKNCEKCKLYNGCRVKPAPVVDKGADNAVAAKVKALKPNDSQKAVISAMAPLNLTYGGPGSGKSASLVLRYIHTHIDLKVPLQDILVIVFTDNNAKDMRRRILSALKAYGEEPEPTEIMVMTCHAFGNMIIQKEYKRFGFSKKPSVIDDEEENIIIAKILDAAPKIAGIRYSNMTSTMGMSTVKLVANCFSIIKENRLDKVSEEKGIETLKHELGDIADYINDESAYTALMKLYAYFKQKLIKDNLIVHADEELLVEDLLEEEPDYLNRFGTEKGFKYVNIDEVQDFNAWQMKLTNYLTRTESFTSLMMVGDDDQAIYGFRKTSPEYMLNVEKYLDGRKVDKLMLMENYRSVKNICDMANTYILTNKKRADKHMIPMRPVGDPIVVKGFFSKDDEMEFIANDIERLIKSGVEPSEIMFIARTISNLHAIGDKLAKKGISTVYLNPEKYSENLQSLAAVAFCRAVCATEDISNNVDLVTVANALTDNRDFVQMNEKEQKEYMDKALALINEVKGIEDPTHKKERLMEILRSFDLSDDEVYQSFLDVLERKNIGPLLEHARLATEYGADAGMRRIQDYKKCCKGCTAHSSKGLESTYCYVCLDNYASKNDSADTEEENRRLAYVSFTRAKDYLVITGEYKAYGYKKDPVLNKYLIEAMETVNGPVDKAAIIAEISGAPAGKAEKPAKAKKTTKAAA